GVPCDAEGAGEPDRPRGTEKVAHGGNGHEQADDEDKLQLVNSRFRPQAGTAGRGRYHQHQQCYRRTERRDSTAYNRVTGSKQLPAQYVDAHGKHKPAKASAEPLAWYPAADDAANKHATYGDGQYGEQERPVDINMADVANKTNQRVDGNDKQGGADSYPHGCSCEHDQRRDD